MDVALTAAVTLEDFNVLMLANGLSGNCNMDVDFRERILAGLDSYTMTCCGFQNLTHRACDHLCDILHRLISTAHG